MTIAPMMDEILTLFDIGVNRIWAHNTSEATRFIHAYIMPHVKWTRTSNDRLGKAI